MRPVKPPLSTVSFSNFIYVLVALLALTAAYFSYRTLQIKTEVRASASHASQTRILTASPT